MRHLLLLLSLAFCSPVGAQAQDYVNHPRLLFTEDGLPSVQQKVQGNGTSASAYRFVRGQAKRYLTLSEDSLLSYLEGLSTIPELGLVHQVEGPIIVQPLVTQPQPGRDLPGVATAPADYGQKGREVVLYLAQTQDVDDDDFASSLRLRTLALGYDMLFQEATPEERDVVRTEMLAYLDHMVSHYEYFRYAENPHTSNRGMMVGAAMGLAVLALWDDLPSQQATLTPLLEFAHALVVKCLTDILASDGSYREGVLYAGWMLRHAIPYIEARARFDGLDLGADPRLARVAEWLCYEVLPEGGGRTNNLNDSLWRTRPLAVHTTYLDWAQARYSSGLAAWLDKHVAGEFGVDYGSAADKVAEVLWHQPVAAADPDTALAHGRLFADRGIYFYRSGWKNDATGDEILLSFHSSPFRGGHAQEDQGQFTLYAYGDRYAVDHGSPEASLQPKETLAHNVVLIDGLGQHNAGNSIGTDGSIVGFLSSDFADYVHSDATLAYTTYSPFNAPNVPFPGSDWSWGYDGGNPVQRAERILVTVKGDGAPTWFLIADDIRKDGSPHEYTWLFHTDSTNVVDHSTNPVVVSGAQSTMQLVFVHPQLDEGLTFTSEPFVHGGQDPSSTLLRARHTSIEPGFFVALVPRMSQQPQPVLSMDSFGSTNASELSLDWGVVRDDAVFNPPRILVAGTVATNGQLALVRSVSGQPTAYLLVEGNMLHFLGESLVYLQEDASVVLDGATLRLSRDDVSFLAWGPDVTQVLGPSGPLPFEHSGEMVRSLLPTDVQELQPWGNGRLVLGPGRPNPFRVATRLQFTLAHAGHARIQVFDLRGRLVRTLLDGFLPAGEASASWDGRDARGTRQAPGIYLVRLESAGQRSTRKTLLSR